MDEKGYVFSPIAVLILIPVLVIAINFGEIVNESNNLASIAIGGDVTYNTAQNIFSIIEKSSADAGRNSAYNATRDVIDNRRFLTDSRTDIRQNIVNSLNFQLIESCKELERQTGREIFINNIPINNYTNQTIFLEDVTLSQEDPFGFYVTVEGGIPIKIVQKDQVYEGVTPEIKSYVVITGLEDPYIWLNSKERTSNIINRYPHYEYTPPFMDERDYHFDDEVDRELIRINNLWNALNGTGNPSMVPLRPYYFPDPHGLSFFDRLENKTNQTSNSITTDRMSTFVIGNPLKQEYGASKISALDHEYFRRVTGSEITIKSLPPQPRDIAMMDPAGEIFFLSPFYKGFFNLKNSYG